MTPARVALVTGAARGIGADTAVAGCARCQACSGINGLQNELSDGKPLLQIGSRPGGRP